MEYIKQYERNILKTAPFSTLNCNYRTKIYIIFKLCNDIPLFILNKP